MHSKGVSRTMCIEMVVMILLEDSEKSNGPGNNSRIDLHGGFSSAHVGDCLIAQVIVTVICDCSGVSPGIALLVFVQKK